MTARRHALLVTLLLLATLLGGCGTITHVFTGKDGDDRKPGADAGASTTPAVQRAVYKLDVVTPAPALTRLLTSYLDLARFQSLPVTDTITNAELDRLVADAPAQAQQLLQTEGYFNAGVTVSRELAREPSAAPESAPRPGFNETTAPSGGIANGDKPGGTPDSAVSIRVVVDPGPRTRVQQVDISATGALQDAAERGDARALPILGALKDGWSLKAGQAFRDADWTTAKNAALAQVRASGYAAARWEDTAAQVDAQANSVRLSAKLDSGPLFLLGELRIEGIERYNPAVIRNLAGFEAGAPYSEKLLLDFQERLQKIGLFGGVVIEIDPDVARAAATPVTVRVRELTLQQTTLGVGFTTNTGERITLEHLQRNVFGTGWQARNNFSLGSQLQSWQGQLTSIPDADQWRKLVAGGAESLRSGDETTRTISARIGRSRESERVDRLHYIEALRSSVTSNLLSTRADALWINYNWVWRDLDSVLLPTRGRSVSLQLGSGVGRGDVSSVGPFGRALGRLTVYRPFGGWYGQARVEAGQVVRRDSVGIPDTLLFRAGGDDSVRGYAYRSLGPNANGSTVSGNVLLTGSVEIAHPIIASLPTLWGAAFIDAGNAADNWGRLKPALGYGVGVRLRSPVGPLRIDVAYGEQVKQFRLHLSVGVTF